MLMIRMQRVGRTNDPAFRIVVAEKRSKPKSGGVETVGAYHPKTKHTVLKNERILYWISKGAKASPTVYNLLVEKGIMTGKKVSVAAVKKEETAPAKSESALAASQTVSVAA